MRYIPALIGLALGTATATNAYASSLCNGAGGALVGCTTGTVAASGPVAVDGIEFRSYSGFGNNLANPDWGSAGTSLLTAPGASTTGAEIVRTDGADSRTISNSLGNTASNDTGDKGLSSMFWAWGQFVDHDITLTEETAGTGDLALGGNMGAVDRALQVNGAGVNEITAYIDASMVYGSDEQTATALRTNDDTGRLLMGADNNLPRDADGNFMAGDIRANEQQQLTTMHTVLAREHNRIADTLSDANPGWSGERIYQESRALVGAQIQSITYNEWLPELLGDNALGAYEGYDSSVNSGMTTEFSSCAFRFCHSMIPDELERLAENGDPIAQGHLDLSDGFFSPETFLDGGGTDPLLRGLAAQDAMAVDAAVSSELRNFLNAGNGEDSDLLARNIARGRDTGLADYNLLRAAYGLEPITSWGELTDDPILAAELEALYGSTLDGLDPFIGTLLEDPLDGALVGALNAAIIGDQFDRLRSGDRFWYENMFEGEMLAWIQNRSLADIIRDNTGIEWIQDNVFVTAARGVVSEPMPLALFVLAMGMLARRRKLGGAV